MIKAGHDVQIFDGERLKVADDYVHLPSKTKALCKWALDHGYTNMLKVDDDAYIWVDLFKDVLFDYAGIKVPPNDGGHSHYGIPDYPKGHFPYAYASGGSYWLSAKSMRIIADAPLTDDWAEDRWVGNTLAGHSIQLISLPNYGCSCATPVLRKNFAVLAQIPDGGIDKIVQGIEPNTVHLPATPHTPMTGPLPIKVPPQPHQVRGVARVMRRNFGRRYPR